MLPEKEAFYNSRQQHVLRLGNGKELRGKPLRYSCRACVCLEFPLTQVLPVKGRLAQEPREASHIPKAQVDSLTRQGMDTMGCIPAKTNISSTIQTHSECVMQLYAHCKTQSHSPYMWSQRSNKVWIQDFLYLAKSFNEKSITFCTILPNQSHSVPYVLWCVAHAQGEHDAALGADPCHTRRELSRWTCRRHDGGQGPSEQRASRLNQLRLVLITPLSVHTQARETFSQRIRSGQETEREKTDMIPLSGQRN